MLAPFYTDIDITSGGEIYWDLDPVAGTITMTWLDVAPGRGTGTNSFQVVLTDTGQGEFTVEYIYEDIQFAGGGPGNEVADVGWTVAGANNVTLDGSANSTELLNYETNDFLNGDPVGTFTQEFVNGEPADPDGTVNGTAGSDTFFLGDSDANGDKITKDADLVLAGSGNDTVQASGGAGSDTLNGDADADTLFGGSGTDSINDGTGADLIYGGTEADAIEGGNGSDTIYGGLGNDTITDAGDATSADTIFGGTGDDSIDAGQGTDLVYGGEGADTLSGGAGTDTIVGGADGDIIYGGDDNDVLIGDTNVTGTVGSESLNWVAEGPSGTDLNGTVIQSTGGMTVEVQTSNDGNATTMAVSTSTQYTEAGEPFATNSALLLGGGAGPTSTTTFAFEADPTSGLSGEVSDVTFQINDIDRSSWQDIVTINAYDADGNLVPVTITLAETGTTTSDTVSGNTITAGKQSDSAADIGGSALIEIAGPVASFEIIYENGSTAGQALWISDIHFDTVLATDTGGNDTIIGGLGDDIIEGNQGNDILYGGEGGVDTDTLSFEVADDQVTVTFDGNESGTYADIDGDSGTFAEIENFVLSTANDTFDATADTLGTAVDAGAGNDTITGGSGADNLVAGSGLDVVAGGAGDDAIFGGAEADTLSGGTGADTLDGGTGDDTITFAEGDTAAGGDGDDLFVLEDLGEATNGTITIDGGSGSELGGDTLQLGTLATLTQSVIDTFVDDGTGSFSGSVTLDDGTILNFSEIENIICFTPGTRVATPQGLRNIEDLRVGDLVVTRDHGLQPIRWIEARTVPGIDRFAPVRISPNVLAGQDSALVESPQHRVLFQGYRAEMLFGESEVLVAAKHLVDGMDVTQDEQAEVTYIHMLFDQHEIIYAQGAATESFHPGDIGFSAVGDAARAELFDIFPELRADQSAYGATARRCLKSHEAKLIRV